MPQKNYYDESSDASTEEADDFIPERTKKWKCRRWAWEFLCLNKKFRAACNKATSKEMREKVAEDFELKKFKHYDEPYGEKDKPKFKAAQISSWTQLKGSDLKNALPTQLNANEVLIIFDVGIALKNGKSLNAQIQHATERLQDRLKELKKENKYFLKSVKRDRLHFLYLIAKDSFDGMKLPQIKKKYFSAKYGKCIDKENPNASQDLNSFHKYVTRTMELVEELVDNKYQYLAAEKSIEKESENN